MPQVLAQDLRNAVLQAAFSGRLTERCQEDSSVDQYLNNCRDKRLEYEKKYKEKKHKSLWESDDYETQFDIPDEWRWAYVGDVFRHNAGKALNAKNTTGTKRQYLTTSNVYKDHFELDNLREMYYTDEEVEKCSVQKGDLLVLEGGDCGRTALWNLDKSYCIQNHLHRLRLFGDGNIKYFFYLLSFYKDAGYTKGKGIAIQGLSANALHNIVIPVPPIEEQARIVARVDELMAKIDEYEKIEQQLTELKKSFPGKMKDAILQAAMQGKLTDQLESDGISHLNCSTDISDDDIPFDIPDGWTWTTLAELIKKDEIGDGDWVLSNDMCSQSNNNLIQIGSVGDGEYISKDFKHVSDEFFEAKNCSELFENDILVSRFISKGHMNVCVIPKLPGRLFTAVDVCWIRNNPDRYINTWLMWCLLSQGVQKQVMSYTAGTTRQRISKTNLMKVYLPLPPIEEQQRIIEKLDQLLPLCEQLEKLSA